jgi:hypothetical protein
VDIHKPKPVHSWRELLSEVGVVVIGIVIALSGEQLVEAVHHSEQRQELRQALDHENRQAIADSKSTLAFLDKLTAWQIALIDQVRAAKAAGHPLGAQLPFTPSDFDYPSDPAFQAASSSGRLSLLTPEEIAAYAEAHEGTEASKAANDRTNRAAIALRMFRFKYRQPDGSVDLSKATAADADHYFELVIYALGASSAYRSRVQSLLGLREALQRGERSMPALYQAEKSRLSPISAMDMK